MDRYRAKDQLSNKLIMKNIYFCGAHSTGKTTLHNALERNKRFQDLKFIAQPEVAREWVKKQGYSQEKLKKKENLYKLNKELLLEQYRVVKEQSIAEYPDVQGCLWDRGVVDPLGYIKCYIGEKEAQDCMKLDHVAEMLNSWHDDGTHVIVITFPPKKEFHKDDGVRLNDGFENICKLNDAITSTLEENQIQYHVMSPDSLQDREEFVLDLMEIKWGI